MSKLVFVALILLTLLDMVNSNQIELGGTESKSAERVTRRLTIRSIANGDTQALKEFIGNAESSTASSGDTIYAEGGERIASSVDCAGLSFDC